MGPLEEFEEAEPAGLSPRATTPRAVGPGLSEETFQDEDSDPCMRPRFYR